MNKTTKKLVILVCGMFVITMAAVLLIYNVSTTNNIRKKSTESINYVAGQLRTIDTWEDWDDDDEPQQVADVLILDRNYKAEDYYAAGYSRLLSWVKTNKPQNDEIVNVSLTNGNTYYIMKIKNSTKIGDAKGYCLIVYNTTSETSLLAEINRFVLIIVLLCGGVTAFLAIRLGIRIKETQEQQEKFFENVSHELKTPLMSIQGYAEGIYQDIVPDQKHAASVIMSESDKMSALVEEILSLSRLESGETQMKPESISISEIVNDCLVALETVVIKRGLTVETHLEDDKVMADPTQAETAVTNIISNAVKYAMHRIVIQNDDKSLSVWNDGGNLSKENLEHIFDRFYIGEKGQTGIGMALAREIIVRHHWQISVKNKDDGIMFTITY
ncbi:MAG: HAMP domain-containing histidine kinase [Eubacteriaceae bacterium]|nr:HAMP domain-containing histidine kinase [Eubacteriaceae bacterium]